jgi:hypothetical protein
MIDTPPDPDELIVQVDDKDGEEVRGEVEEMGSMTPVLTRPSLVVSWVSDGNLDLIKRIMAWWDMWDRKRFMDQMTSSRLISTILSSVEHEPHGLHNEWSLLNMQEISAMW